MNDTEKLDALIAALGTFISVVGIEIAKAEITQATLAEAGEKEAMLYGAGRIDGMAAALSEFTTVIDDLIQTPNADPNLN